MNRNIILRIKNITLSFIKFLKINEKKTNVTNICMGKYNLAALKCI